MRYSLIFTRSTTFTPFSEMLKNAYSGRMQRMVVLALAQMLWDRAEANGYSSRMRGDPPPNTPIHDVLFQTVVGDHQVPQISSEIMARTVGSTVREPAFDTGRSADKIPFYAINPAPRLELGTTLTMWDGGPVRAGGLGTDLPPVARHCRRRPAPTRTTSCRRRRPRATSAPCSCSRAASCSRSVRCRRPAGPPRTRTSRGAPVRRAPGVRAGASSTGIPLSTAVPVSGSTTPESPRRLTLLPACALATASATPSRS